MSGAQDGFVDEMNESLEEDFIEASDEGDLQASMTGKVVLDKADRSLSELLRWHDAGRIILDPEWQRNYVWDDARASKLIESFLLDIPVPVIYLAKTEDEKYEVIDGLQRLTAVFRFLRNAYPLQRLDMRSELRGKTFKELPERDQRRLEDAILRSFELSSGQGDLHFIVFERLNTGGIKLNDMEIRNCLFRGSLNSLIRDLALDKDFRLCINQNNIEKRMNDRSLVLRFLAFYERTHHKCQSGLKRFLNEFLRTYQNAGDEKIAEYEAKFKHCMRACVTVFGKHAFRLRKEVEPGSKSAGEWGPRSNAAIFQVIATSFANYDQGQITRAADAIREEYLDLISTDETWVDRVQRSTGDSSRLRYVFDTWQKRLDDLLRNVPPNDGRRVFSRRLKEEIFDANQTCGLCGQRIAVLDDAVLDHDTQYWRGGRTIPENAQLVHRLCNLKKG